MPDHTMPEAPRPVPMCRIVCETAALVSLGHAPLGERRYVPLTGGRVHGPEFNGRVLPGGVDWQIARADGALDIQAHYVLEADDGGLVEVHSTGLRHAAPEVMQRLARGESVPRDAYFFRTTIRFTTGAPGWDHLNRVIGYAVAERQAQQVVLDVYRLV